MAVRHDPADLPEPVLAFLAERHLATLTTLLPDGRPHVTPVGFTWDPDRRLARVITSAGARKVRNLPGPASLCQVDGRRWLTLDGDAALHTDADAVAEAVDRYATRYRAPSVRPDRVAIELTVRRIIGWAAS
jgi:F420H(2)-dependent biliverdin reductase